MTQSIHKRCPGKIITRAQRAALEEMKKPKVHIVLKTVNMNGFNGENAIKEVILLRASSCVSPFSGFAPRAWTQQALQENFRSGAKKSQLTKSQLRLQDNVRKHTTNNSV